MNNDLHLNVDMDGVISRFVEHALAQHVLLKGKIKREQCVWNFWELADVTETQFWSHVGYAFWRTIPVSEDGMNLIRMLLDPANDFADAVRIATSPYLKSHHGCCEAKSEWIRQHIPQLEHRTHFSTAKWDLSHSHSILVDDNDENCAKFRKKGGQAIVIPRPWNSRKHEEKNERFDVCQIYEEIREAINRLEKKNL